MATSAASSAWLPGGAPRSVPFLLPSQIGGGAAVTLFAVSQAAVRNEAIIAAAYFKYIRELEPN